MNYLLKYLVSLVKLIKYLIKCFLLTIYLMVNLWCYFLMVYYLTFHLRTLLKKCPIMVLLWCYLLGYFNYFLLRYGIYIFKTYFKKFSYNKDIKMNILY